MCPALIAPNASAASPIAARGQRLIRRRRKVPRIGTRIGIGRKVPTSFPAAPYPPHRPPCSHRIHPIVPRTRVSRLRCGRRHRARVEGCLRHCVDAELQRARDPRHPVRTHDRARVHRPQEGCVGLLAQRHTLAGVHHRDVRRVFCPSISNRVCRKSE